MVIMRPNEKIRYEVQAADTNHLASICGKRNADNFSQSTAEQGRSSYVDKEKSEELASQTRLQLPSGEAGLPLNGIIRAQASLARQKTLSAGGRRRDLDGGDVPSTSYQPVPAIPESTAAA